MHKRTCTLPGCDKPHRAKGLCGTHYNQQNPNRYRKVIVQCSLCGEDCEKEAGRAKKYAALYCSLACRDVDRKRACDLPANHWARWYGATSRWTAPRLPEERECSWCGALFSTIQPRSLYCGHPCRRRAGKLRRRAREVGATGEYTWAEVMRIHLMGDRRCSYCDAHTDSPDPDHVVPISRGGRNDIGNILPCCRMCNNDKSDMTLVEWEQWRRLKGKVPVRTIFDRTEPRFRHLIDGVAIGQPYRVTATKVPA